MSKVPTQRKGSLRKNLDRDLTTTDNDNNHRRLCYQLFQKEKQRRSVPVNDNRKMNDEQLEILREILFDHRDINGLIRTKRANRSLSKSSSIHNGRNHCDKSEKIVSTKVINSSNVTDSTQLKEYNHSLHSDGEESADNSQTRLSRLHKKEQQLSPVARSLSLYSQSRPSSSGFRTTNGVSFVSDRLKNDGKLITHTDSNTNSSSEKLKKLIDHLSCELNDLEAMTGSKSHINVSASHTCSVALATALISLTGYVKQCVQDSKNNYEINNIKEEISVVFKTQLDFQKKMESQMLTMQTMMQTICQLVNTELISTKKNEDTYLFKANYHDEINYEAPRSSQNWLNNAQRPYLVPKDTENAMNELLMFTRRMNDPTPPVADLYHQNINNLSMHRHPSYLENIEGSKKRIGSSSSASANEMNSNEISKQGVSYKTVDQDLRSSAMSPVEAPSSYDLFESGLPNRISSAGRLRNSSHGSDGMSTNGPTASMNETLLEKILHERLRLVQQMAELSKQHEMTQEELANLESKAMQSIPT